MAVVCAVGCKTRWQYENPCEDLEDDNEKTPLSQRLEKLAEVVKSYAMIAAALISMFMLFFLTMKIIFSDKASLLSNDTLKNLVRIATTAIAITIVSVPEGLALAVSIAMAFSIKKMIEQKLLVKKMAASENLAYTNIICTGKTGILTDGNMQVKEYFIGGASRVFNPHDFDIINDSVGKILANCIILNNDAKIEMSYDKNA